MKTPKRKNITWQKMPGSDELDKKLNHALYRWGLANFENVGGKIVNTGGFNRQKRAA